ncbi:multi-copper polyphenol oxidoreductase laccase [Campylobacter subantarcticus LMG 24377]|uniref:Purine nucleoside phosphorylase n=2 Tax=Campylobacter subantarcticus TaxID=497724 RepID=A0A0A8HAV7_9BACT|nr:peptidoglycan editing factor PgeF [Campylobacter subantarcticus]EAJ1260578.1 peptidoglycan editing factor PgeF [Campylobacter lari]AJC91097.1 multi-copper polyphenol oxidoreductase laccase [Campylobacter subantarcticus LMG 24374]AJC92875.1 multi-copper polyphenol oxidoreductase laccase [Campylobacter subantarcticus LMG 24377]EAL3938299.1 peptidoglycan editing factor PgeF [Campylobacter lari]MPB99225.1 peptidoglycan editing factor PgeF [Campylobacter subantarcticus]
MATNRQDYITLLENNHCKAFIAFDQDYNIFRAKIYNNIFPWEKTIQKCIFLNQIHSNIITCYDKNFHFDADGVISNEKNVALCILSADCLPLLLYDDKNKVIAALHSGRKGCFENILKEAILKMQESFNTQAKNLKLIISAGICAKNYKINGEILNYSKKNFVSFLYENMFDLKALVKFQAKELGVEDIFDINLCTFDDKRFFSYRENKTPKRIASVIYLKD